MKKLIIALLLLVMPLSAMAMDTITSDALDGVSGQAGVTLGFCGTTTTTIDFSKISWGDPDGVNTTCGSLTGWLIISGVVTIRQTIADGQTLAIDIGRTAASTCDVCGASGAVVVPSATVFIAIDLPAVTTSITVPTTLYVGLGSAAGTIAGTIGILNLAGLSVTQGTPSQLIIWAHP